MSLLRTSLALSLVLIVTGCANPDGLAPARRLADPPAGLRSADASVWPAERWWAAYDDERLSALIDQALNTQPGLQATLARVRLAQAAADYTVATQSSSISSTASLNGQRFSENAPVPAALAGHFRLINTAQIALTWEPDLFGRQRAAIEASIGRERAAQADHQAARVLLASQIGSRYFNLARLGQARELALQSLRQREQMLQLVKARMAAGLDTTLELRQVEGLIAQAQVEREALSESFERERHALAELTGQAPAALDGLAPELATIRPRALPVQLPADLVGRRADLTALRWRVEAALSEVDRTRAQFHPNLNLAGFVGLSSVGLSRFAEAGSLTAGVGPALSLPLFTEATLRASLGARSAETDLAIEDYNAALLRVFREVADELGSLRSLAQQRQAQQQASEAAEAAYGLAMQRYRAGLGNFLTVLTVEVNVLAQRRAELDLRARLLQADLALTRALGGGWHEPASAAGASDRRTVSRGPTP